MSEINSGFIGVEYLSLNVVNWLCYTLLISYFCCEILDLLFWDV